MDLAIEKHQTKKHLPGFTLVELIVTITILAIFAEAPFKYANAR